MSKPQLHLLQDGEYRLHEVHIARSLALLYADQREFIEKAQQVIGCHHPVEKLESPRVSRRPVGLSQTVAA